VRGHAIFLSCALAATASANEAFLRAEVVDAVAATKLPMSVADPAWQQLSARSFRISPQRTVRLNDLRSNEVLKSGPGISEVRVKAAATAQQLRLWLEWDDPAKEVVREDEVNVFADSIAVEVPERSGRGVRLPAIGMGDAEQHVGVSMLRATKGGALASQFIAAGFGSLTRQAPAVMTTAELQYDDALKRWRAVFTIPIDGDRRALVPVAFAVWDGARGERAGYKRLSSWHFVRLPNRPLDDAWVKELAYGFFPGDLGDVARGKALAEAVCVACHHLPGKALTPPGLAPSLVGIGAISTPRYLRDSITTPSAVVLPGLNPNQHYVANGPRDNNGALPNADAFRWWSPGPDGGQVSKMPPFAFPPEQLADLVAFLKSLDGSTLEQP